jgi:hypothetical protein
MNLDHNITRRSMELIQTYMKFIERSMHQIEKNKTQNKILQILPQGCSTRTKTIVVEWPDSVPNRGSDVQVGWRDGGSRTGESRGEAATGQPYWSREHRSARSNATGAVDRGLRLQGGRGSDGYHTRARREGAMTCGMAPDDTVYLHGRVGDG